MKKKIYRTVIRFEVLSEDPIPDNMTMGQIEQECDMGSYSGRFLDNEAHNEIIEGKAAADLVKSQGSDPEFFNMDEEGRDTDVLDEEVGYKIIEHLDDHVGYEDELVKITGYDRENNLYTVTSTKNGTQWTCSEDELEATDVKLTDTPPYEPYDPDWSGGY